MPHKKKKNILFGLRAELILFLMWSHTTLHTENTMKNKTINQGCTDDRNCDCFCFRYRYLTSCRWKCCRRYWQEHTCWPSSRSRRDQGCLYRRKRLSRLSSCPRYHQTGGRRWLVGLSLTLNLVLDAGSVIRYSECCVVRLSCSTAYTAVRMASQVVGQESHAVARKLSDAN